MTGALGTIIQLATSPALLGPVFSAPSWRPWLAVLRAMFALPLDDEDRRLFTELAQRTPPATPVREGWFIIGRRAGKSMIAALIAVYATCCRAYRLAPGETGVFMVIASDRRQARVVRRYIGGLLHSSPVLAGLVESETAESIRLTNGLAVEIHTASFRSLRGYTVVGAVCDEVAFWMSDESANPDREILTALRSATVTVPDALIVGISSPYARRGELWRVYQRHFGQESPTTLVLQAPSRALNPLLPQARVDEAYEDDPAAAAAEWGAEFRRDVEAYIDVETLQAAVVSGRGELLPVRDGYRMRGHTYVAFVDPAGGSGADSFTLAVAHQEGERVVLDAVREERPPFSPEAVVREFARFLWSYGVRSVTGDRYAGEWPREAFRRAGVEYVVADRPKSELYRDVLPLLNSGRVELLDDARLVQQFTRLERRVSRGGRDTIDHGPRAHDDVANAVAGALVVARGGVALGVTPAVGRVSF